ncbi:MAG: M42 family metallopeptidase [Oscillospiraceae bacterium]
MSYVDYITETFKKLTSIDGPSGFADKAADFVVEELTQMGYEPKKTVKGGVLVSLGGKNEQDGLLLTAHLDTLGGMVRAIKANGRLRISPIGGFEANNVEAENCKIYTRGGKVFTGCLQLDNASTHVNKDYHTIQRSFDTLEVVLDTLSTSKQETLDDGIQVGDFVCVDPKTTITETGFVKSRFIDDKMSVAVIIGLAKFIKENNITPERAVYAHITIYEEVGHGGCGSVPDGVTEILGVDMGCVGDELNCSERQVSICVKDSRSPSNYDMITRLIESAKANKVDYALDVYPMYGSDCDAALGAGWDLRHALIGSGVYASHGYERTHIDGIKNTFELLKAFIG